MACILEQQWKLITSQLAEAENIIFLTALVYVNVEFHSPTWIVGSSCEAITSVSVC